MKEMLTVSEVKPISPAGALLGESPLWKPDEQCLYWLDIKGYKLHRHDATTGENTNFTTATLISAIALAADHDFICVTQNGFAWLDLDRETVRLIPIADPEANLPGNRFNDGAIDPEGGFWAGTLDNAEQDRTGQWWRLAPDLSYTRLDAGFMVTNGPAFAARGNHVYFTDSADQTIFRAQFKNGTLTDKQPHLTFAPEDGYPDGMTLDAEDCLWVAFWDGACLRRFAPDGRLLTEIPVPAKRPTSVALVGDRLYITSAAIDLTPAEQTRYPASGALFSAKLSRPVGQGPARVFGTSPPTSR